MLTMRVILGTSGFVPTGPFHGIGLHFQQDCHGCGQDEGVWEAVEAGQLLPESC